MIRTAYEVLRDLFKWGRAHRNAPEFELRDTRSLQAFTAEGDTNIVIYQVLIENIGSEPAHNCTPKIYFHGIRPYDSAAESVDAEITVDTIGCWSRSGNPSSLSLSSRGSAE
jgi:hypothetical protein